MGGGAGLHRGGPVGAGEGLGPERVFYDGACGLCHGAVRFLIRRDRRGAFRFAPLGGDTFLREVGPELRAALPDSLVLITAGGRVLVRTAAVRHLLRRLGGVWALLAKLVALLPQARADGLYDALARRRRRWFRRPEATCPVLPPDQRVRFDP